jgi:hypothetical protein
MIYDVEFGEYLETIIPEFLCIKSQEKIVLKEGGMFAPSIDVANIKTSNFNSTLNIIVINFIVVDKGGYHNRFDKILVSYDQDYINNLYSDFLILRRNKKLDIINV